jgi:hypothetical protein
MSEAEAFVAAIRKELADMEPPHRPSLADIEHAERPAVVFRDAVAHLPDDVAEELGQRWDRAINAERIRRDYAERWERSLWGVARYGQ